VKLETKSPKNQSLGVNQGPNLRNSRPGIFFAKDEHIQGSNSVENKGENEEIKSLKVN
jgi:hypothetical protein